MKMLLAHKLPTRATTAALILGGMMVSSPSGAESLDQTVIEGSAIHLEVFLNGEATNLVARFSRDADGSLAAEASELREIGLDAPDCDCSVDLGSIEGISYSVNERDQSIAFDSELSALADRVIDLSERAQRRVESAHATYGAFVNYDVNLASSGTLDRFRPAYSGASIVLDGRLLSPYGTVRNSFIVGHTLGADDANLLRLDTTYEYADLEARRRVRALDIVTGGFAWTRPVRLGGLQISKDFGLRPDLITMALPSVSGSAAVPSSLDLIIDGSTAFSQELAAGPFELANIPVAGAREASLVLRDSAGRETTTQFDLFSSPQLLEKGAFDYSLSIGRPRLGFGASSGGYTEDVSGSASGRYGYSNLLTFEGHTELAPDLALFGSGFHTAIGNTGVLSVAGAVSSSPEGSGTLAYANYNLRLGPLQLDLESRRTFGAFRDLAAVSAGDVAYLGRTGDPDIPRFDPVLPARAFDRISLGFPVFDTSLFVQAGFTRVDETRGGVSEIANISLSAELPWDGSVLIRAAHDFGSRFGTSLYAGVHFPLGGGRSTHLSAFGNDGTVQTGIVAQQNQDDAPGGLGWRIGQADSGRAVRNADFGYGTSFGDLSAGISERDGELGGSFRLRGAVAGVLNGGVHLARPIDDSFVVVDVGAAGIPISVNNRPAGRSGLDGRLVVSRVDPFGENAIEIDIDRLPIEAVIPKTKEAVRPKPGNAAVVDFGIDLEAATATITLVDEQGAFVEPGAEGHLNGTPFVVGYDGEAYLSGLLQDNHIRITVRDGECQARLPFDVGVTSRSLEPVVCRLASPS